MQQEVIISFILRGRVMTFERCARGAPTPSTRPPSSAPRSRQAHHAVVPSKGIAPFVRSYGRCYGVLARLNYSAARPDGRLQPPFQRSIRPRNAAAMRVGPRGTGWDYRGRPNFSFGFGFGAERGQMGTFGGHSVSAESSRTTFGALRFRWRGHRLGGKAVGKFGGCRK